MLPELTKFMDSLRNRSVQAHKMIGQIVPPENPKPSESAKVTLDLDYLSWYGLNFGDTMWVG